MVKETTDGQGYLQGLILAERPILLHYLVQHGRDVNGAIHGPEVHSLRYGRCEAVFPSQVRQDLQREEAVCPWRFRNDLPSCQLKVAGSETMEAHRSDKIAQSAIGNAGKTGVIGLLCQIDGRNMGGCRLHGLGLEVVALREFRDDRSTLAQNRGITPVHQTRSDHWEQVHDLNCRLPDEVREPANSRLRHTLAQ